MRRRNCYSRSKAGSGIAVSVGTAVFLFSLSSRLVFSEPYYLESASACKMAESELSRLQTEAQQGVAQAQLELGKEYRLGYCFKQQTREQNDVEAGHWFQKAADQGLVEAKYQLGTLYRWTMGVLRDEKKSIELIKEAAGQGFADAQYSIGAEYADAKEASLAVLWLEKAALQGHRGAMSHLANIYYYGPRYFGSQVKVNKTKALDWYWKMLLVDIRNGSVDPNIHILKDILLQAPPDPVMEQKLALLYKQAVDKGIYCTAQLGVLYELGRGVEKDFTEAYMWYSVNHAGNEDLKKNLTQFLTQDQMKEAENRAREYLRQHPQYGIEY